MPETIKTIISYDHVIDLINKTLGTKKQPIYQHNSTSNYYNFFDLKNVIKLNRKLDQLLQFEDIKSQPNLNYTIAIIELNSWESIWLNCVNQINQNNIDKDYQTKMHAIFKQMHTCIEPISPFMQDTIGAKLELCLLSEFSRSIVPITDQCYASNLKMEKLAYMTTESNYDMFNTYPQTSTNTWHDLMTDMIQKHSNNYPFTEMVMHVFNMVHAAKEDIYLNQECMAKLKYNIEKNK